jgi:hypothetical protein
MKIQAQLLLLGAASAFVWGVSVAPSYALNLIGNLPPTDDNSANTFSPTGGVSINAVSFTLPTGTDYTLDNAVLRLGAYDGTEVFNVQIRNDTGGVNPGSTVLANFTLPAAQGAGIFDYTFNSPTAFTFTQNTKYWLYVDISTGSGGSGSFDWLASSPNVTPTGVASFGAYRFSLNNGTSFVQNNTFNSFQVNATAVPWETDALPVIGSTVLFGLGLWGKRKLAQKKIDSL